MAATRPGDPMVMMASGTLSRRTLDAAQLYSDPRHAVAVSGNGELLDLEREQPAAMPVVWRSHPVALDALMGRSVRRVVWHVSSVEASLALRVTGQRGIMAQDVPVSEMTVNGAVNQPLAAPVMMRPARTVRLEATGTAVTGTLLLPILLYISHEP